MTVSSEHSFSYSAFENFFRGPRDQIKQKLFIYLPLVTSCTALAIKPALDIGCGRGEWLELLGDNYINAVGIDSNAEFVDYCQSMSLKVEMQDLFEFLAIQGDQQYSLITGFHIIEHIPPDKQLGFLHSVFRLLSPGGIIIFETPNPENVTVGSCNFYIDPTHIRPIPTHLLQFLALQAGFASPLIARLNRDTVGAPLQLMADSEPGAAHYNQLVHMIASRMLQAPDYSLIAFKPPAPDKAMINAVAAINHLNDSFIQPPDSSDKSPSAKEYTDPLNTYTQTVRHTYRQLICALKQANNEIW